MKTNITENVQNIPITKIKPFRNHPFVVKDNEDMKKIVESIDKLGTITPLIARPINSTPSKILNSESKSWSRKITIKESEKGSVMHDEYHTNTNNKDIHYFSCSNYKKDTRGNCESRHYIRADAVEQVVMLELRRLSKCRETNEQSFAHQSGCERGSEKGWGRV